ncbi:hypothetical protein ACSNOI_46930, partial [Actinomadura kijaniata]|uniref:hypothetical protein n=1 Tax=Actinomadura kijaniata TaxID=46161 RepID=UPI003F1DD148
MLQRLFGGGRPEDDPRSLYPGSPAFSGGLPHDPSSLPGLAARWWRWACSVPGDRHPCRDATGRHAGVNQPEDVFFLAGTFGGEASRACAVPGGVPLFFPVLNVFAEDDGKGVPHFRRVRVAARLNGVDLPVTAVTNDVPYRLVGVPGNPMTPGADGRDVRIVGSGHWCRIDPLAPGGYVLEFAGDTAGFSVAVTYDLTAL